MAIDYTSPYVVGIGVAALVSLVTMAYGWRRRPRRGAVAFSAVMACVGIWTLSYTAALVTPDPGTRVFWEQMRWVGTAFVGVPWFVFAMEYTGLGRHVTRRRAAGLMAVPALTVVAVWTNEYHHLFWTNRVITDAVYQWHGIVVLDETWGPVFYVFLAYTYSLVGVGTALLLREAFTADNLYADQSVSLTIGALVPVVVSLFGTFVWTPVEGFDLTPYAFAFTGLALGNALVRYRFLDMIPATRQVGRDTVVRNMRDGVVVLDEHGEVIDVNPVAQRALGRERSALVGKQADEVVDGVPIDEPGSVEQIPADDGQRTYEVHVSPLDDHTGREVGTVLVLRDVTDRQTREQRLTVLNRVLRHNIRNDMNAIGGLAGILADEVDEPRAHQAAQIRTIADEIVDLADKARKIEQLMARREQDPRPSDLTHLVEDVTDWVDDRHTDVDVSVTVEEDIVIPSRGILKTVVRNVVDNAAEHNDAEDPTVEVTVQVEREDPPTVEVAVVDNGPGIPPQERDVLLEGTETALKHGSGLGLWLVYWGTESLDGEIGFEENDPRGSIVRIRVPFLRAEDVPGEVESGESVRAVRS